MQELHGDPWSEHHTLKTSKERSPSAPVQPVHALTKLFKPGEGSTRPRMGRRASYDLFEAVETKAFSEDEARDIFVQIGESANNSRMGVCLIS